MACGIVGFPEYNRNKQTEDMCKSYVIHIASSGGEAWLKRCMHIVCSAISDDVII